MTEAERIAEDTESLTLGQALGKWLIRGWQTFRRGPTSGVPVTAATRQSLAAEDHDRITAAVHQAVAVGVARMKEERTMGPKTTKTTKTTKRPKNKAKTLAVLATAALACSTLACGVRLPAIELNPQRAATADGDLPGVSGTLRSPAGMVLGGGSVFVNPAALAGDLVGYVTDLLGKFTGKGTPAPAKGTSGS